MDDWWVGDERERKRYGRERRQREGKKQIIRILYGGVCIVFEILC